MSVGERPSGPVRSMSQVERIRANMEAQARERADGAQGTHRPVVGGTQLGSPSLNKGPADRDNSRFCYGLLFQDYLISSGSVLIKSTDSLSVLINAYKIYARSLFVR